MTCDCSGLRVAQLAITMYPPDFVNQLPLNDMSIRTPPGRETICNSYRTHHEILCCIFSSLNLGVVDTGTHMYYTGDAEFTFGTGLSYS